jgi:hypothetical protein
MPSWRSMSAFVDDLSKSLTPAEIRKITRDQAEAAQKVANRHAARDLGGDRAFSGWRRSAPIPLDTVIRNSKDATILSPTKRTAGGWTVAEFGRNSSAGPRMVGPRLTKTGKISKRRARRYNGTTRGKGTASDAVKVMEKELPKVADKGVTKALRKRFDVT